MTKQIDDFVWAHRVDSSRLSVWKASSEEEMIESDIQRQAEEDCEERAEEEMIEADIQRQAEEKPRSKCITETK